MRRSFAALTMSCALATPPFGTQTATAQTAAAGRQETEILAGSIPPYVFEKNAGAAGATSSVGVLAELVKEMARRVGHSGHITYLPWARAQQMTRETKDGVPKLLIPLTRTQAREFQYKWVVSLLEDEAILVTIKGKEPLITSSDQARELPTGALLGSPQESLLRDLRFTKIEPGVDEETNARKLNAGRLKVWFVAKMVAPFLYKQAGFKSSELQYGIKLRTNDLYLGASPALPDSEAEKWRGAMRAMQDDGTYEKIVSKHRE